MTAILSAPTTTAVFPAGTADTDWSFVVTGTNADGTAFSASFSNSSATMQADLPVGATVTLVVTKNGISSLPSDAFTVTAPTVTLTVPDATQKAVIAAA